MDTSPNLGLPYILASQAQKHVTHNEAIRKLDAIVQLSVADRSLTVPPPSPADGDRYIVAAGATGSWAGKDQQVAAWQDGVWMFYAPQEGWVAWIADEDALVGFDGLSWSAVGAGSGSVNPTPMVGVNATADLTNRLSISSPACLFNHEGSGHQLKVNKSLASDTASLLFQTGFSGRAEIGLTGSDDFQFKVSPDGNSFFPALNLDRNSGKVSFPSGAAFGVTQIDFARTVAPFESTSTSYVDVPGMSLTITPASLTSKILIMVSISAASQDSYSGYLRLMRDGTEIFSGDGTIISPGSGSSAFIGLSTATNWSVPLCAHNGLDEPATLSPVTYKLQCKTGNASQSVYVNRNYKGFSAGSYLPMSASHFIIAEIIT